MKNRFVKICKWLLTIIGFAGTSSCILYGSPYADYEIKCKVIDADTKATIKGIKLTPGIKESYTDENGVNVEYFNDYEGGKLVEKSDGTYKLKGITYDIRQETFIDLKLTDPDPSADGHYKDSIYNIPLDKIKDGKSGSWKIGLYSADVTIEAEPVKE